jgi:hypothetical protein
MLQDLIDIIAAPQAVFTRLKERPAFLLPLLLVVVAAIGSSAGYLLLNDEGFVKDQIIEQALGNRDMPAETRRNAEKQIESMSVQTQAAISCAAIAIIVPLITAIYAAYLGMVNKFSAHQFSFKHWFSLASWTGIPNLIAALVSIVVLLTDANGQVSQQEMQPLSITGLLAIDTDSQALQQVNLMTLWALGLAAVGYQQWTGKSMLTSIAITWAPYVLIYGGLALRNL